MINCLISLIIVVIIALVVLYVLEAVLAPFIALPAPIMNLIRLLVGLLVLLWFLQCVGIFSGGHELFVR